jgi:hypothetical protein
MKKIIVNSLLVLITALGIGYAVTNELHPEYTSTSVEANEIHPDY